MFETDEAGVTDVGDPGTAPSFADRFGSLIHMPAYSTLFVVAFIWG
ncbi:MAG: hypothetical protein WAM97_06740 [Acidimicrobiales bacterium]